MAQIELQEVSRIYNIGGQEIRAVDGVSLSVEPGEFISIVGHSGSGKTTLLSIIGGIQEVSSGKVLFNGRDIYGNGDRELARYRAEDIGYIFQFASLIPSLTAIENLLLPGLFSSRNSRDTYSIAGQYLHAIGLGDRVHAFPHQLSGGQQRRVAIARALMNDPEVIVADEPTGDLDEETERDVMEFLKRINRERGITLILVTHNPELTVDATRRYRMNHGHLYEV